MKVSEAIDILKRYPKDCEIYLKYPNDCETHHCKDWEDTDENGNIICPNLIYLYRLHITCDTHMEEFHKGCEVEVVDKVIFFGNANEEPKIIG